MQRTFVHARATALSESDVRAAAAFAARTVAFLDLACPHERAAYGFACRMLESLVRDKRARPQSRTRRRLMLADRFRAKRFRATGGDPAYAPSPAGTRARTASSAEDAVLVVTAPAAAAAARTLHMGRSLGYLLYTMLLRASFAPSQQPSVLMLPRFLARALAATSVPVRSVQSAAGCAMARDSALAASIARVLLDVDNLRLCATQMPAYTSLAAAAPPRMAPRERTIVGRLVAGRRGGAAAVTASFDEPYAHPVMDSTVRALLLARALADASVLDDAMLDEPAGTATYALTMTSARVEQLYATLLDESAAPRDVRMPAMAVGTAAVWAEGRRRLEALLLRARRLRRAGDTGSPAVAANEPRRELFFARVFNALLADRVAGSADAAAWLRRLDVRLVVARTATTTEFELALVRELAAALVHAPHMLRMLHSSSGVRTPTALSARVLAHGAGTCAPVAEFSVAAGAVFTAECVRAYTARHGAADVAHLVLELDDARASVHDVLATLNAACTRAEQRNEFVVALAPPPPPPAAADDDVPRRLALALPRDVYATLLGARAPAVPNVGEAAAEALEAFDAEQSSDEPAWRRAATALAEARTALFARERFTRELDRRGTYDSYGYVHAAAMRLNRIAAAAARGSLATLVDAVHAMVCGVHAELGLALALALEPRGTCVFVRMRASARRGDVPPGVPEAFWRAAFDHAYDAKTQKAEATALATSRKRGAAVLAADVPSAEAESSSDDDDDSSLDSDDAELAALNARARALGRAAAVREARSRTRTELVEARTPLPSPTLGYAPDAPGAEPTLVRALVRTYVSAVGYQAHLVYVDGVLNDSSLDAEHVLAALAAVRVSTYSQRLQLALVAVPPPLAAALDGRRPHACAPLDAASRAALDGRRQPITFALLLRVHAAVAAWARRAEDGGSSRPTLAAAVAAALAPPPRAPARAPAFERLALVRSSMCMHAAASGGSRPLVERVGVYPRVLFSATNAGFLDETLVNLRYVGAP